VVARDFINLLYGSQFWSSSAVFQILVWALVIAVTRSGLEIGLIASQRQNQYLRGMAFAAVLHTVLAPIGYSIGGIAGLATAMLVAESCYAIYIVLVSQSVRVASLAILLWRVAVAAAFTFILLFVFPMPLLVSVLAGVVLYGGCLILLGELSAADRVILRQLVGL
jgi:O-antigen/teichoic acid export membrane protein